MAQFGINDIAKVSVNIKGSFGEFTLRNYGEAASSIILRPADNEPLYYRKYGTGGQALFSKSYKPKNMEMELNILRLSQDYANMQKIVQIELSGGSAVFECTYIDENTGETVTSSTCVLSEIPAIETGADINPDATYLVAMADATMTPPSGSVI
jgi:hypothetical protein